LSNPATPRPQRKVVDSQVEMTEIVMPNDANPLGNVMGGRVMHWADIAAAVAAGRHARTPVVTASVDNIDFHRPARVGSVLVIYSSVNFAGRTSMEVGVKIWNEDRFSGQRSHIASAYMTFVSLDPSTGTPSPVPEAVPETPDQIRRHKEAQERRRRRLEHVKSGS